MMRSSLLAFSLVAGLGGAARADAPKPPPAPPAPPATADIQVEINDSVGGAAPSAPSFVGAVSLAVGDCGEIEAGNGTGHYEIRICYEIRSNTAPPLLTLDVERTIHGHAELHQKMKTTTPVAPGQRVVLGRFGQGGDSTEVAATVR